MWEISHSLMTHLFIKKQLKKKSQNSLLKNNTQAKIKIQKGHEAGIFNLGSTTILLFEKNSFKLEKKITQNQKIQMGNKIGNWI